MATRRKHPIGKSNSPDCHKPGKWLLAGLGLFLLLRGVLRGDRLTDRATPSQITPSPGPLPTPIRDHERRDANAKWIFGIVAFLAVSVIAIHFILAGWLRVLNHSAGPTDRWRPVKPGAQSLRSSAPFPRLQVSAPLDLQAFRARELAELNGYGWINRTAGIVHIPIERAMDLVLQEGLPTRNQTNAAKAGPSSYELIQRRLEREPPASREQK